MTSSEQPSPPSVQGTTNFPTYISLRLVPLIRGIIFFFYCLSLHEKQSTGKRKKKRLQMEYMLRNLQERGRGFKRRRKKSFSGRSRELLCPYLLVSFPVFLLLLVVPPLPPCSLHGAQASATIPSLICCMTPSLSTHLSLGDEASPHFFWLCQLRGLTEERERRAEQARAGQWKNLLALHSSWFTHLCTLFLRQM